MLNRFNRILANLDVFPETMLKNMDRTYGLIYSQRVLLKLIDERQNRGTIIVGSQLMEVEWKHKISDPAIGEAILDRLVHNAFRVTLKGRSMREKY